MREVFEFLQPGIRDLGLADVERRPLREVFELLQPRIRNLGLLKTGTSVLRVPVRLGQCGAASRDEDACLARTRTGPLSSCGKTTDDVGRRKAEPIDPHASSEVEPARHFTHSMNVTGGWFKKLDQNSSPLAKTPSADNLGACQRTSRNPALRNAASWIGTFR